MNRRDLSWFLAAAGLCLAASTGCALGGPEERAGEADRPAGLPGEPPVRLEPIDRVGRPEMTNFIMRAPAPKVPYNREDVFALSPAMRTAYGELFRAGVSFWDGLDGLTDWNADDMGALVEALLGDYLIVDPSTPCSVDDDTYLDVELSGSGATTCGGRTPNADVVDTTITILIGGVFSLWDGNWHRDNVDSTVHPARDEFPYLGEPYPPAPPTPPPGPPAPEQPAP